ncbi:hypothetical protein Hdeb2414_s0002g00082001 [Helianthus debilis subsp. tardiflorus]
MPLLFFILSFISSDDSRSTLVFISLGHWVGLGSCLGPGSCLFCALHLGPRRGICALSAPSTFNNYGSDI